MKRFLVLLVVFCIVFVGCVSDNSDKGAMYYFNKGLDAYDAGDCEKAIEYYDKALEIDPKLAGAMQNKAVCLDQLDRKEEAISTIDKMLSYNSNLSFLWYWKGNMFFDLGRYNNSIKSYKKAIQKHDQNKLSNYEKTMYNFSTYPLEVWYNMCLSLANLGRYNESIDACEEALEIDPSFVNAYAINADAYSRMGDFNKTLAMYNSMLRYDSSNVVALFGKAYTFALMKEWERSLDTIENIPADYHNHNFYYLKGLVLYGAGDYRASLVSLNNSLEEKEVSTIREVYGLVNEAKSDPSKENKAWHYLRHWSSFHRLMLEDFSYGRYGGRMSMQN